MATWGEHTDRRMDVGTYGLTDVLTDIHTYVKGFPIKISEGFGPLGLLPKESFGWGRCWFGSGTKHKELRMGFKIGEG
jgi:hypothetical protein